MEVHLKATGGGQVGAPCGCIGCFDDFDHIQGSWQHSRKKKQGSMHALDFSSLVCGCDADAGGPLPGKFDGVICGDRDTGPLPRPAPANLACFTGVGDFSETGTGKKTERVAFRVEVEDRGEPGAGTNSGPSEDVYDIRIWRPTGNETVKTLVDAICCRKSTAQAVADAGRQPDIFDGGNLIHGNLQIHPQIPSHADECPGPSGGVCSEEP
jgi:hypothetical protein